MGELDSSLIVVVVIAFIAGYSVVDFVVGKIKSARRDGRPLTGPEQADGGDPPVEDIGGGAPDLSAGDRRDDRYRRWQQDEKRRREATWESHDEESVHAAALGLEGNRTPADVERAYRESIARYHPDLGQYLDPESRALAEQKRQAVITAYRFFRQKFRR